MDMPTSTHCGAQGHGSLTKTKTKQQANRRTTTAAATWDWYTAQDADTDLIRTVRDRYSSGPLIVVDRYGGTEAATFCALATLLRQLDFESHVDVYQYAKVRA